MVQTTHQSESLDSVHHLVQGAYIVLVDWERRIVRRYAPYEVRVVVVMVTTLYHPVLVCHYHIHGTVYDTYGTIYPLHAHNITVIELRLH